MIPDLVGQRRQKEHPAIPPEPSIVRRMNHARKMSASLIMTYARSTQYFLRIWTISVGFITHPERDS